jgi:hypothetical protein
MQSWVPAQWLWNSKSGCQCEPSFVAKETFGHCFVGRLPAIKSYSNRFLYCGSTSGVFATPLRMALENLPNASFPPTSRENRHDRPLVRKLVVLSDFCKTGHDLRGLS